MKKCKLFIILVILAITCTCFLRSNNANAVNSEKAWYTDNNTVLHLSGDVTITDINNAGGIHKDTLQQIKIENNTTLRNDTSPGSFVSLFQDCANLESIGETLAYVTPLQLLGDRVDMSYLFNNCTKLKTVNLKTSGIIIGMRQAFNNCNSLTSMGGQTFDITYANAFRAFAYCGSLTNLNITRQGTMQPVLESEEYSVKEICLGCSKLQAINGEFNIDGSIESTSMFENCYSLEKINLSSNYPVIGEEKHLVLLNSAFRNCTGLKELNLQNMRIDLRSKYNVTSMFEGCTNLNKLDIRNFKCEKTSGIVYDTNLFKGCDSLTEIILPTKYLPSTASDFPYNTSWYASPGGASSDLIVKGYAAIHDLEVKYFYEVPFISFTKAIYTNFYANGGEFKTGDKYIHSIPERYNEKISKVTNSEVTRNGYMLLGWDSNKDVELPSIIPEDESTLPVAQDASENLYAIWAITSKSVIFHAGEGASWDTETTTGDSTSTLELPNSPSKTGYEFTGWSKTQGSKVADIIPSDPSTYPTYADAADNYYGVWLQDSEVTFYVNSSDAQFPDGTKSITILGNPDSTLTKPIYDPVRQNYTFLGWASTKDATQPDVFPPFVTPTFKDAANQYYAVWKEDIITITFYSNANDATFSDGSTSQVITGNATNRINVPNPNPVREGFDFLGYGATPTSKTVDIDPSNIDTYPLFYLAYTSYYAIWVEDNTVTFDAGEDAVFPSTGSRTWTEAGSMTQQISLPSESPIREYYQFLGWATTSTAKEPNIPNPLPSFDDAAGTYYAVWEPMQNVVMFSANGGAFEDGGKIETTSGELMAKVILPDNPLKNGFTFVGWSRTQSDQIIDINPSDASTIPTYKDAATQYWAIWQENMITVTFNTGDDSQFPDGTHIKTITGGSQDILALPNNPVREGFDFLGWGLTPDATIPSISPDQTSLPKLADAALNYYAIWRTYTKVYFSATPGVFPDSGEAVAYTEGNHNAEITLPTNPVLSSYKFIGWSMEEGDTIPDIIPGKTTDLPTYEDSQGIYYAVWEELTRTITFNANSGSFDSGEIATTTGSYSHTLDLPKNPTKQGYTFVGWALTSSALTPTIIPDQYDTYPTYKDANDIYYAVYIQDLTVLFDANNGEFKDGSTQVQVSGAYDVAIELPEQPEQQHYTFLGWSSIKTATTPEFPLNNPPIYQDAAKIYYAVWKAQGESIKFYANGGVYDKGKDTITMTGASDATIIIPSNPTMTDKVFGGYSYSKTASKPIILVEDESTYPTYSEVLNHGGVLYAFWLPDGSVQFNATPGVFEDGTKTDITYGELSDKIIVPSNPIAPEGMKFDGWSSEESATTPDLPHPYPTYGEASEKYFAVYSYESAHWVEDENGLRYIDDNGVFLQGEWATIDGTSYYFKNDTYMANNGWLEISGRKYFFYSDGQHAQGWKPIDGKWYYFQDYAVSNWVTIDGDRYYFNSDCSMYTGWLNTDVGTYYLDNEGVMVDGIQVIDDSTYYFVNGVLQRNATVSINGKTYAFDNNGKLIQDGWITVNGDTYYSSNGVVYKGWIWFDEYNDWFYFNDNGAMQKDSWSFINGYWYGFWSNGKMCKGWVWDSNYNNWFYCNPDSGIMQKNCWSFIDGYWYGFWWDGQMCYDWIWDTSYNAWFYCDYYTGKMSIGWSWIYGSWYYFNNNGTMVMNQLILANDGYWFVYSDGKCVHQ